MVAMTCLNKIESRGCCRGLFAKVALQKKNSRQIQWWLVLSLNFAVLNLPMLSNPKMVSFLKNIFMVVQ
jgi:hypothetical protein